MLETLNELGFHAEDILYHIINAIILFVIVRFLIYKPVRKFMQARSERIAGSLEEAAQAQAQAEQLRGEYEQRIAAAEDAARQRALEITCDANESARAMTENAQEEARRIVDKARAAVQEERSKAMAGLQGEVIDLAAGMAAQILRQTTQTAAQCPGCAVPEAGGEAL